MLLAGDIEPGSDPSYQLCKLIYIYHPLGKKLADTPVTLAQSQPREISVAAGPDRVRQKFTEQWTDDGADGHIFNIASLSRIYGIASVAILAKKKGTDEQIPPADPLDYSKLADLEISFNVFDPLNTAGSLVGNLNPNEMGFMKTAGIAVNGTRYHRSRAVVLMNEKPIYLDYNIAAYGYVGRSVYQRALFPLKSFVKTMIADEMVATKVGVIVAKMKAAGSIITQAMQNMFGLKRNIVKEAETWNVISITPEEDIESLNLRNLNTAMEMSRRNILNNVAVAADMPAIIINSESYANGFGEGSQDAYNVSRYIEGVRSEYKHVYDWFDNIIMHRAWNKEFYDTLREEFPDEYGDKPYATAFAEWKNSFEANWPSLIQEPESEKIKVADVKLKSIIALVQILAPELDPENKSEVIKWAQDNFNELEDLFTVPLDLDFEALAEQNKKNAEMQEQMAQGGQPGGSGAEGEVGDEPASGGAEPDAPRPFSAADSQRSLGQRRRLRAA